MGMENDTKPTPATTTLDPFAGRVTLKVPEAAQVLGINAHTLRRLIERGEIKVIRALRHPLIPVAELKRFASV